jgi:adenosylcobinamide-phosphate guanylyltransferase
VAGLTELDALLLCGGRGTRLDADVEKPLYAVGGEPMVDRAARALADSAGVETTYAVTSPQAPETAAHVADDRGLPTIETPGEGYVADLQIAMDAVDLPVLTVAADLPLLAGDAVDRVLREHDAGSLTVRVPTELKRRLGCSVATDGRFEHVGLNVVADMNSETTYTTYDARLAVNVNREMDGAVAEAIGWP